MSCCGAQGGEKSTTQHEIQKIGTTALVLGLTRLGVGVNDVYTGFLVHCLVCVDIFFDSFKLSVFVFWH